jgi:hypothetical protein
MLRHRKALAAAVSAAAVVLGIAVPAAFASPASSGARAFACYSKFEVDPGVWSTTDVFPTWDSYAQGYWAPYAEQTVPTQTKIGNYYLLCNLPAGMAANGSYVFGGGTPAPASSPYVNGGMPIPGIYPVAAAATTPATSS